MNAHDFLNQFFMMTALGNWAEHIDKKARVFDNVEDLTAVGEDGVGHDFPEEGQAAYRQALDAGERPGVSWDEEHGWFVTHVFGDDADDDADDDDDDDEDDLPAMRMVCWAEMGPEAFSKMAARWWQTENPAMPNPPPEGTPEPEPTPERERGPWDRKLPLAMVKAVAEGMGDVDPEIRHQFKKLHARIDEMSDWQLWQWLDKVNFWHHAGAVSGVVKAGCWIRPFSEAPERPDPEPDSTVWAFTWSARPYSTTVQSDTPMNREAATAQVQADLGRIPVGLALWPCEPEGRAL